MSGLHCRYDTDKFATAYFKMPSQAKEQLEALRQSITEHLRIKNDIENRLRAIRAYEMERAERERMSECGR